MEKEMVCVDFVCAGVFEESYGKLLSLAPVTERF